MIQKHHLSNGIPVYIVETHTSPVVSVQAWIKRGSIYETEAEAGISHFLEHSLFKGTKKRKVGEIANEVESRGGEINAFTSFEETVYYTTLASRFFDDGLDIITDSVLNPSFDAEEMEKEKEVILEEIKRSQDSPYRTLSQNLWRTMFKNTPYGRPVLGFEKTVKKMNASTLRRYHQKNYHAGTTALIIVGDISVPHALKLAEKKIGKMKKGKNLPVPNCKIQSRTKPLIVSADYDIKECQVQMAWIAPSITDPSVAALDLACSVIGQGECAKIYQRLVKETRLATDVSMGLVATARNGMVTMGFEVNFDKLEESIKTCFKTLQEVQEEGLKPKDIDRVKTSLESDVVYGKETVEGYARRLGYYHIQFGDPDYEKKYLEAILGVEKDEAEKEFFNTISANPVLSLIHPKGVKIDTKAITSLLTNSIKKSKPKIKSASIVQVNQKDSIRYIGKPASSLPTVALKFIFPGGSYEEKPNELGLSQLFKKVWTSGTQSYRSHEIAHQLESVGASLHAFAGKHSVGLSVEFLTKHWQVVKPLLTEVLLQPTFDKTEFETEKSIQLREIASERDTPGQICQLNFFEALYPEHPYGRSSSGKADTVRTFTQENLKKYYTDLIHQKNLIVSMVGQYDTVSFEEELHSILSKLPKNGRQSAQIENPKLPQTMKVKIEKKEPLNQSHLLVGFLSCDLKHSMRYPLKLLSSALAGQGGRLFMELRDKQSLAYQVAPIHSDTLDKGMFGFYIGCSSEKLTTAIHGIRRELDRVLNDKISKVELERAKSYWLGRFELEMQRYSSQAMLYGMDELVGLGFEHSLTLSETIRKITQEDIQKAAQTFLVPEKAVISIVHPSDLEEGFIKRAWEGATLINTKVKSLKKGSL